MPLKPRRLTVPASKPQGAILQVQRGQTTRGAGESTRGPVDPGCDDSCRHGARHSE